MNDEHNGSFEDEDAEDEENSNNTDHIDSSYPVKSNGLATLKAHVLYDFNGKLKIIITINQSEIGRFSKISFKAKV